MNFVVSLILEMFVEPSDMYVGYNLVNNKKEIRKIRWTYIFGAIVFAVLAAILICIISVENEEIFYRVCAYGIIAFFVLSFVTKIKRLLRFNRNLRERRRELME